MSKKNKFSDGDLYKNFSLTSKIIFFLNSFIAFMIIGFGGIMIQKGGFARYSIYFGFIMLFLSTALRIVNKW